MSDKNLFWKLERKEDCYKTLEKWWKQHKAFEGNNIPYESMPNRVFTALLKEDGETIELYKVAVYVTDSDMCWIGWITSNPETTLKQRYRALEFLYKHIAFHMYTEGYNVLISKTKQTGLMKALDNTGFLNIEPQTNFYIKDLTQL